MSAASSSRRGCGRRRRAGRLRDGGAHVRDAWPLRGDRGPDPEALWPNNYGEWKDGRTLSRRKGMPSLVDDCVLREWPSGLLLRRLVRHALGRPHAAAAGLRAGNRRRSRSNCAPSCWPTAAPSCKRVPRAPRGAQLFEGGLAHDADGSSLQLSNGDSVRARVVVDATGFESKLVAREDHQLSSAWAAAAPGYQIAYGCPSRCRAATLARTTQTR